LIFGAGRQLKPFRMHEHLASVAALQWRMPEGSDLESVDYLDY